jgi:biopolymer transport protein ExbD
MHDINVTPFVDVMLVLLIVFMVAAPLLLSGLPVDPPPKDRSIRTDPITVTLDRDGKIYLGTEQPLELWHSKLGDR